MLEEGPTAQVKAVWELPGGLGTEPPSVHLPTPSSGPKNELGGQLKNGSYKITRKKSGVCCLGAKKQKRGHQNYQRGKLVNFLAKIWGNAT